MQAAVASTHVHGPTVPDWTVVIAVVLAVGKSSVWGTGGGKRHGSRRRGEGDSFDSETVGEHGFVGFGCCCVDFVGVFGTGAGARAGVLVVVVMLGFVGGIVHALEKRSRKLKKKKKKIEGMSSATREKEN